MVREWGVLESRFYVLAANYQKPSSEMMGFCSLVLAGLKDISLGIIKTAQAGIPWPYIQVLVNPKDIKIPTLRLVFFWHRFINATAVNAMIISSHKSILGVLK